MVAKTKGGTSLMLLQALLLNSSVSHLRYFICTHIIFVAYLSLPSRRSLNFWSVTPCMNRICRSSRFASLVLLCYFQGYISLSLSLHRILLLQNGIFLILSFENMS